MLKIFLLVIFILPLKSFADDICFDLTPVDQIDDQNCTPVKVNIQYKSCTTGEKQENISGAMARFECKRKIKQLKYWHENAMLFANLAKKGNQYVVVKTYAVDYGRKDPQSAVVSPPSSVVAIPLPSQLPLPSSNIKNEKPSESALNNAIEKTTDQPQIANQEVDLKDAPKVGESTDVSAAPAPAAPKALQGKSEVVVAPLKEEGKSIFSDVKINGLVDFYYLYNLNQNSNFVTPTSGAPAPVTNVIYLPNTYNDQFTLNLAMLSFKKDAKPWGFGVDLAYGPASDLMSGGVGERVSTSGVSDNSLRALNQAYIIYKLTDNVSVKAGRFHSYLGFESHYAHENFNYTKSYGRTFLAPALLQGVGMTWNLGQLFEISIYVTNGFDVHYENNRSKSFGTKVKYTPIEEVELTVAAHGGNEYVTGNDANTAILEGSALWKPSKNLKLAIDFTGGQVSVAGNDPRKAGSLAGYAWLRFIETMAVSFRYEMYTDDGFYPSGLATQNYVTSQNQILNSATATIEYWADEKLKIQAEYRIDSTTATTPAFKDSTQNPTNAQSLALGSMLVSF